jgi:hypothetical protein
MKPIHILTADETAGVIAHQLALCGQVCTWGQVTPPTAKYVILPAAPAGPAQADGLTSSEIMRAVRNAQERGAGYRTAAFSVELRSSQDRGLATVASDREGEAGTPGLAPVEVWTDRRAAAARPGDGRVRSERVFAGFGKAPRRLVVATVCRCGAKYGPAQVVWLLRQCCRMIETPFRFVCLTDWPEKVPGVVDLGHEEWTGWWAKMELFRPGLFEPGEEVLYLDLDTVLTRRFAVPEAPAADAIAMVRFGGGWFTQVGSGAMLWRAGLSEPYDWMTKHGAAAMATLPSDQEAIIAALLSGGRKIVPLSVAEVQEQDGDGAVPEARPAAPIWCAAGSGRKPWDLRREWIPRLDEVSEASSVALVTCWYGSDPLRLAAARQGAARLCALPETAACMLLVEAVEEPGRTQIPEWTGERLEVVIEPGGRQDCLWHKEALLNLGGREVFCRPHVMSALFCDLDVYPTAAWAPVWLSLAGRALMKQEVVQPWRSIFEADLPAEGYRSYGWMAAAGAEEIWSGQGFCTGMKGSFFFACGGWPSYCLSGGGDALAVQMMALPRRHVQAGLAQWRQLGRLVAEYEGPRAPWGWLPCEMLHASHGRRDCGPGRRMYGERNWVWELCGGYEQVVERASNGLWRWRDTREARAAWEMQERLEEVTDQTAQRIWQECLVRADG